MHFFHPIACSGSFWCCTHLHTYLKINLFILMPSYLNTLPQRPAIPLHACRCTCSWPCLFIFIFSWPYLFIFILSIQLTVKIYPSTFPLFYMSTDVPVNQYTCSVYFFFFGITCAMTFQLTYPPIHPKINSPVYPHASPLPKNKDLPITTTTFVPAHICTCSWPYLMAICRGIREAGWKHGWSLKSEVAIM